MVDKCFIEHASTLTSRNPNVIPQFQTILRIVYDIVVGDFAKQDSWSRCDSGLPVQQWAANIKLQANESLAHYTILSYSVTQIDMTIAHSSHASPILAHCCGVAGWRSLRQESRVSWSCSRSPF